jgi:AraC-like DNA-binding protein
MLQNPRLPKADRLSTFFAMFTLSVPEVVTTDCGGLAHLVITGLPGQARTVQLHAQAARTSHADLQVAARLVFDAPRHPLIHALPATITMSIGRGEALSALVDAFVMEAQGDRCGRPVALDRLCALIVLHILRDAVDKGTSTPGLLAGLSHPHLHRALTALHEAPGQPWRVDDLARLSGLSRSRFMEQFPKVLGVTPARYLTRWRLVIAQRELARGARVKSVARQLGFASAASFTRAFTRGLGHRPSQAATAGSEESRRPAPWL